MKNKIEIISGDLSFKEAVKKCKELDKSIESESAIFIPFKENFDGICANHVIDPSHVAFFGHPLNHK